MANQAHSLCDQNKAQTMLQPFHGKQNFRIGHNMVKPIGGMTPNNGNGPINNHMLMPVSGHSSVALHAPPHGKNNNTFRSPLPAGANSPIVSTSRSMQPSIKLENTGNSVRHVNNKSSAEQSPLPGVYSRNPTSHHDNTITNTATDDSTGQTGSSSMTSLHRKSPAAAFRVSWFVCC